MKLQRLLSNAWRRLVTTWRTVKMFPVDAHMWYRLPERETRRERPGRDMWLDGPWRYEPDKVTWVDESTGLDCMIIRNPLGTLCGYVGVPPSHPYYKINYSGCINRHAPLTFKDRKARAQKWVDEAKAALELDPSNELSKSSLNIAELSLRPFIEDPSSFFATLDRWDCTDYSTENRCPTPESVLNAHGGITYSDECDEDGPICHPGTGNVWWFGFDCGHYRDFSPGMEASRREMNDKYGSEFADPNESYDPVTGTKFEFGQPNVYRDVAYVKAEVEGLAQQLEEISSGGTHTLVRD